MFQAIFCKTPEEVSRALEVRRQVNSGGVAPDGLDPKCLHLLLIEDGRDVGAGRLYFHDGAWFIDAMSVLGDCRGRGLGDVIFRTLLYKAAQNGGLIRANTPDGAPARLAHYMEKFGFERVNGRLWQAEAANVRFPADCGK